MLRHGHSTGLAAAFANGSVNRYVNTVVFVWLLQKRVLVTWLRHIVRKAKNLSASGSQSKYGGQRFTKKMWRNVT